MATLTTCPVNLLSEQELNDAEKNYEAVEILHNTNFPDYSICQSLTLKTIAAYFLKKSSGKNSLPGDSGYCLLTDACTGCGIC